MFDTFLLIIFSIGLAVEYPKPYSIAIPINVDTEQQKQH